MSKPAFVEMAEKDMNFEVDWVIKIDQTCYGYNYRGYVDELDGIK